MAARPRARGRAWLRPGAHGLLAGTVLGFLAGLGAGRILPDPTVRTWPNLPWLAVAQIAAVAVTAWLTLRIGRTRAAARIAAAESAAAAAKPLIDQAMHQARLHESAANAAHEELSEATLRMVAILDTVADGVFVCDQHGRLTLVNPAGWRLLGLPDEGALGPIEQLSARVNMRDPEGPALEARAFPLMAALAGETVHGVEVAVHNAELGDDRYLRVSAAPLRNADGLIVGAVAVAADVTEVKETLLALKAQASTLRRLNQRLEQAASSDSLTGLYNHRRFVEELAAAAAYARGAGQALAVLVIDVDHFKQINDTLGHPAGDAVLRAIAARLRDSVRATDSVGRLGGDEFAVLLPDADGAGALAIARRVREAISAPVSLAGCGSVPVTASIGVVCRRGAEIGHASELLQQADDALYAVKRAGRDGVGEASAPLRRIA